jgi:hypothetical protein
LFQLNFDQPMQSDIHPDNSDAVGHAIGSLSRPTSVANSTPSCLTRSRASSMLTPLRLAKRSISLSVSALIALRLRFSRFVL